MHCLPATIVIVVLLPFAGGRTQNPNSTSVNREHGKLRYGTKFLYDLSNEDSYLDASITVTGDDAPLIWCLKMAAAATEKYSGQDEAPYLAPKADAFFELPGLPDWRDLVGKSVDKQLTEDSSESVYSGFHNFAKSNRVRILERRQSEFLISAQWDIDIPVEAEGWIPFTGVLVCVDDEIFGERIRAMHLPEDSKELPPGPEANKFNAEIKADAAHVLQKYFAIEDFGEPEIRKFLLVWFPLKSQD